MSHTSELNNFFNCQIKIMLRDPTPQTPKKPTVHQSKANSLTHLLHFPPNALSSSSSKIFFFHCFSIHSLSSSFPNANLSRVRENFKERCLLISVTSSSSFSFCQSWAFRAAMAASSASRCTTASPTPSRSGRPSPGNSRRRTTFRRREASSTTRNWPAAIAFFAAASSPRATRATLLLR